MLFGCTIERVVLYETVHEAPILAPAAAPTAAPGRFTLWPK